MNDNNYRQSADEEDVRLRTSAQHRSLMLYETELARAMVEKGIDLRTFLKEGIEIPATKQLVHDHIVKPIIKAMFNKNSTTELEVHEISELYDVINKNIGEKAEIHVPFPSADSVQFINEDNIK
jgi:hypothetical protein